MPSSLRISSDLEHDGDHVVRFEIVANSGHFMGSTGFWGNDDRHLELASAISGFPQSSQPPVEFLLGYHSTSCKLTFDTANSLGRVRVTAQVSDDFVAEAQSAQVVFTAEPAALDEFVRQLRGFTRGVGNTAQLVGDVA